MIYFTIKKLNEKKAFFVMLCFLLAFGCKSEDKGNGDGGGDESSNGNGDATKYTLTIGKPTNGAITSEPDGIDCGSKGKACKAEFDKGTQVTLTAMADTDYAPAAWQGACDKTEADQPCQLSMDANKTAGLMFGIDTDGDGIPNETDPDDDGDKVLDETDVDDDNDGLIEVHNLDMFDHIRYNLAGTAYKAGSSATASILGAPASLTANCKTASGGVYLCGYELMRDLDFNEDSSYATGSTKKNDWRPNNSDTSMATNAGFVGIDSGFGGDDFAGIFEGNGHSISNFYSRNTNDMSPGDGSDGSPIARVGLFKSIEAKATIRNLGVVDARLYGSASDNEQIGSLVSKNKGTVVACHATGKANGGVGTDEVGGLVGVNTTGTITDSHATVAVDGGAGSDLVGGLVGRNKGNIRASYATGTVDGSAGSYDFVGGLVGVNTTGTITDSYATGTVNGGAGEDKVGGLVGSNQNNITASYATGTVNGGAGEDRVGGLVGSNQNNITASHAMGNVNGGTGSGDKYVGGLVGLNKSNITASHAMGNVNGGTGSGDKYAGGLVGYNNGGSILASYATGTVNGGDGNGRTGGLVGRNNSSSGKIIASYATGDANDVDGGDRVGGLVGLNDERAITIASYATGDANGGDGDDRVGNLIAKQRGSATFTASYGFGSTSNGKNEEFSNNHPAGLAAILSKANKVNALTASGGGDTSVDASWDNAGQKTLNAWDFGTNSQPPALKYADYDGAGASSVDYCALFPAKIPGTDTDLECDVSLLPNQPGR